MLRPTRYATFTAVTNQGAEVDIIVPHLGRGTYGTVHPLAHDDGAAAKLYRECRDGTARRLRHNLSERLDRMIELETPWAGDRARVAWPTGTLRIPDDQGELPGPSQLDGYLMERVPRGRQDLTDLWLRSPGSPRARQAADLLEEAIHEIHRQGFVIGDVSGQNFALAPDGNLWIYDTDGWQFTDRQGRLHRAMGATERYTHPDLIRSLAGAQPNCTDRDCPLHGAIHRLTPTCRPRRAEHDDHGIARLARELRGEEPGI